MPHMMDDFPLLLSTLYDRAVRLFPDQQIVSIESDRSLIRTSYADTDERIRRLATALDRKLGVSQGQAVGTFAWNNQRHHELYWATANTGRICHTLNIRLFADQLVYIINHGEDRVVFVDPDLTALLAPIVSELKTVKAFVVMGDDVSDCGLPNAIAYEDLIADVEPHGAWPELSERSPHMFCYTSGTTGDPKGVAYTQRSTYMHVVSNLATVHISPADNVMPIVPMFHASAWGYPFMATTQGSKLTYPGPDLTAEALVPLIESERVSFSAGVPTVMLGMKQYLEDYPGADISSLQAFLCGGSAVPRSLIEWFWKAQGVRVIQGWGMTETNPVASVALLKPHMMDWDFDRQLDILETAGLPTAGLQVKIVDDEGHRLPEDGEAFGELLIRGPWVTAEYYNDPRTPQSFLDGWLRTGDVCKITPEGYVRITDRAKDLIKSGGEWISSVDLENQLMAHPEVMEAAVVGARHDKWQERPVALVVTREGSVVTEPELLQFLRPHVVNWWLPDRVIFIDEIPKTGTGKFDKKVLRDKHWEVLSG